MFMFGAPGGGAVGPGGLSAGCPAGNFFMYDNASIVNSDFWTVGGTGTIGVLGGYYRMEDAGSVNVIGSLLSPTTVLASIEADALFNYSNTGVSFATLACGSISFTAFPGAFRTEFLVFRVVADTHYQIYVRFLSGAGTLRGQLLLVDNLSVPFGGSLAGNVRMTVTYGATAVFRGYWDDTLIATWDSGGAYAANPFNVLPEVNRGALQEFDTRWGNIYAVGAAFPYACTGV